LKSYLILLREHPSFTRIWLAQVISLFGDWFNLIALLGLVAQYTNQSGLAASGLLIARFLPPFLVSPLAGVLVDRFDRKMLLIWSDVLRALIGVSLFLAISPERLWIIYLATILQFMLSALFEPARSALVPNLIPADMLLPANALSNITWSVMLAVGAVFGGLITGIFGVGASLLIDVISFAVSAFVITRVRVKSRITQAGTAVSKEKRGFRDGLNYVRHNPQIGAVLLVKFGLSIGSVDAIMSVYATSLFIVGENGAGSLGILYGAFGIGAILGPLILNRYNDGKVRTMRRLVILSYACVTFGWILIGLSGSLLFASLALVVRAMGGSATWTYSSTIIQLSTDDHFMGRVFSLDWSGFYLAITISTLVIGVLIDTFGKQSAPQITVVIGIISVIPFMFWIWAVRWLERHPQPAMTPVQ
jgi:MFS family permease